MTRNLFVVTAIAYAVLLLVSLPQLADPLVRHDDFPALFGDEHLFYHKTLAEGRWLNYWWMARPFIWEPWVNFALYQLSWAVFSAAAAVNAFGAKSAMLPKVVLAIVIVLSPQAFLISGWFNTLVLGGWFIAAFAVLNLYLSNKAARWAFLICAPVSMMAYSTYPMMMIALCMTRHDARRSFLDLVGLVLLLALSIGLGMMLMYTVNYFQHGIFGIELSEWRDPNPATDLASLMINAERLMPMFLERLFASSAFGVVPIGILNLALLVGALMILWTKNRWLAVYAVSGMFVFISVIAVHGLKEGVQVPMRALMSVWVMFAVLVVVAFFDLQSERWKGLVRAGMIVLIGVYGGQIYKHAALFDRWQKETIALAEQISPDTEAVFIFGRVGSIPGVANAHIDHPTGLSERIRQLTGVLTFACSGPKGANCVGTPPFDMDTPGNGLEVLVQGPHTFMRIPDDYAGQADMR